jgi:hypothetical protein
MLAQRLQARPHVLARAVGDDDHDLEQRLGGLRCRAWVLCGSGFGCHRW